MRRIFPPIVFLLLAIAVTAPALLPGRTFFPFHTDQFDPLRDEVAPAKLRQMDAVGIESMTDKVIMHHVHNVAIREALQAGEFPWWHHGMFGGIPLLGMVLPGLLYPLHWPFFLLADPYDYYAVHLVLHLFIAAAWTFAFLRRLGSSPVAASLGAVVFAFSGWMAARAHFHMLVSAAAWIPAMFFAAQGLFARCNPRDGALLALATGLSFLAGFPAVTLVGLHLLACYTVWMLVIAWRRRGGRAMVKRGAWIGAAVLAGLLLATPQLLSGIEYRQRWARKDPNAADLRERTLEPAHLLGLVWPTAFVEVRKFSRVLDPEPAEPAFPRLLLLPLGDDPDETLYDNAAESAAYVGLLPLALLATLPFLGTSLSGAAFLVLALFFGAIAFAVPGIFDAARIVLPGFSFGTPNRYLLPVTFALAVLAAIQLDRAVSRRSKITSGLGFSMLMAGGLGILLYLVTGTRDPATLGREVYRTALQERAAESYGVAIAEDLDRTIDDECYAWNMERTRAWILRASMLIGLAGIVLVLVQRTRSPSTAGWLAIVLVFVDLGLFFQLWVPPVEKAGLYRTPRPVAAALAMLGEDRLPPPRIARIGLSAGGQRADYLMPPDTLMPSGVDDSQGYTVPAAAYEELLDCIEPGTRRYGSGIWAPANVAMATHPLFDLLGVRFFFAPSGITPEERSQAETPGLRIHATPSPDVTILENLDAFPRAFFAPLAHRPSSDAQTLALLGDPSLDFDARSCVLLDPALADEMLAGLPGVGPPRLRSESLPARGERVEFLAYDPASLALNVTLPAGAEGYLVLSDTWAPGWEAWVDEKPAEVLRVDHALRAVEVRGGGTHFVRMKYRERSVRWTLGLSALVVVVLALGALGRPDSLWRRLGGETR